MRLKDLKMLKELTSLYEWPAEDRLRFLQIASEHVTIIVDCDKIYMDCKSIKTDSTIETVNN